MNYWIKLDDGRWIIVDEYVYNAWTGEKDVTVKLKY